MYPLRFNFDGSNLIGSELSSQAGQDLFALAVLNGKTNGTYLEIGAGPAISGNNTYVLEKTFNWNGASVDREDSYFQDHKDRRTHYIELADATKVNYSEFLLRAGITQHDIDYLSLDVDAEDTLNILLNLPLDTHRFAVITFEHDSYIFGPSFKSRSRQYLIDHGYVLAVSNISLSPTHGDFEDWWVHPELVDMNRVAPMIADDDSLKYWKSYIFQ